jgi:Family of unknown function (DUF6527)
MLRTVNDKGNVYQSLMFICPGCKEFGNSGLHMLAVNSPNKNPSWTWNENLEKPSLSPSIRTTIGPTMQCHSFLEEGVFKYLSDCSHSLAGKDVEMEDLPDWVTEE